MPETDVLECNVVPDWNDPGFLGDWTSECYGNEKAMVDHLIAENENINGVTCVYYRLSLDTGKDEFMGDDVTKHAVDSFRFMAMYPDPSSKNYAFGIKGVFLDDSVNISCGIAHFMASQRKKAMPPMVGDVVQTLFDNEFWQIIYVDDMSPKTQAMQVKTVYSIKLKSWENNRHGAEFPLSYASAADPSLDDPMGDLAGYRDLVGKKDLFGSEASEQLDSLRDEDRTFYVPDASELPPNNDKDNPFPRF